MAVTSFENIFCETKVSISYNLMILYDECVENISCNSNFSLSTPKGVPLCLSASTQAVGAQLNSQFTGLEN